MFSPISACRLCQNPVQPLFSVPAPLVSAFPLPYGPPPLSVPLDVVRCTFCEQVQLANTVDPAVLYAEYWYESGVNERMRQELATVVERGTDWLQSGGGLEQGDHVLDIGANDGTLLRNYRQDVFKVAVDPAQTFQERLRQIANLTIQGTWPECAEKLPPIHFKLITSIACFYDLQDPIAGAAAIRRILHPYGIWVCQFQDLEQQVRQGAWDNFVHEHLHYFTLGTFNSVVREAGLQIVHVESTPINGGSLRVFVGHAGSVWNPAPSVQEQFYKEYRTLHHHWPNAFAARMWRNIGQVQAFVDYIVSSGGAVDLYGASTKGNTLLQATQLSDRVRCAWERNPRKYGRTTVTGVPIIDEELGRSNPPAALLTTIWQFLDQIIERERDTLRTIRLIVPLPEATWVETKKGEDEPAA